MIRPSLIVALLLVPAAALAQNGAVTPGALDLSIPQAPMRYLDDPAYQSDAPGTFYGDHSGRGLRKDIGKSPVVDEKLQVHGAVSAGIGYSKAYGNSNWQTVDLNLGKNITNDEGKTRRVDLNIHMSKGEGVGPYGYGPGPWYGW
ncbi:hypothetical protein ACSBPQ_13435 [Stenotrophomonas sp. JC08]|uniref:hypothetical protein n=1 Tax=Stenotrophomonas sp. JC08 TaxID=3445779 RepID=UPI003FA1DBA4